VIGKYCDKNNLIAKIRWSDGLMAWLSTSR